MTQKILLFITSLLLALPITAAPKKRPIEEEQTALETEFKEMQISPVKKDASQVTNPPTQQKKQVDYEKKRQEIARRYYDARFNKVN